MSARSVLSALLVLLIAAGWSSCDRRQDERPDRSEGTDQGDPAGGLPWGTYLGRDGTDEGFGLAVDASGCAYITGFTSSEDFPTTAGAFDRTFGGGTIDAFVVKLDPEGRTLVYSTLLGGSGPDRAWGIAVDESGCAFITGRTRSSDFPVTSGAFDVTANGDYDLFVARLGPEGRKLEYGTYLGGRSFDNGAGIALDDDGCAYVTGWTSSADFPVTEGAFDRTLDSQPQKADALAVKLDRRGRALHYATFLGGGESDWGQAIAVDEGGRAYIGLYTGSHDFPVTPEGFQTVPGGITDGAVVKLDPAGGSLIYGTFLGGSAQDWIQAIAVDDLGRAHLTGVTYSGDFPVSPGAFDTRHHGHKDAFVAGLDPSGGAMIYGAYLGGADEDQGTAIQAAAGRIYMAGATSSADFSLAQTLPEGTHRGKADAFWVVMDAGGDSLIQTSLLGGSADDVVRAIACDGRGHIYLTGWTESPDLPVTPGAVDETYNGKEDIFLFKVDPENRLRP